MESRKPKDVTTGVKAAQAMLTGVELKLDTIQVDLEYTKKKAKSLKYQMDLIVAILRHSEPVFNTNWEAVAGEIDPKGRVTAAKAKKAYTRVAAHLGLDNEAVGDDAGAAGPSRTT
ncbi:hypothetical protein VMCG_06817 [Cytospora schulzeri]|uniref:Uncharacterized protein n=1 Tax=Cytospora schulzeri TaxID=448051 RepID=A0A423W5Z3_9PEZI|nr:hypothetical protein VMCG_06817 [Valsa malicola]